MDVRRRTGSVGEDLAVAHLVGQGYEVLDRNWRAGRLGEIDVVLRHPEPGPEGTLVFCEVKCRRGTGYGSPLEAITYAKLRRLNHLACEWIRAHDVRCRRVRIDALGVLLLPGQPPAFQHAEGVGG